MNRSLDELDQLAALDPAAGVRPDPDGATATAIRDRIFAEEDMRPGHGPPGRKARRRPMTVLTSLLLAFRGLRASARMGVTVAAVAAITVLLVAFPRSSPTAFAGWTSEPADLSDETRAAIEERCNVPDSLDAVGPVIRLVRSNEPATVIDMRGNAAVAVWSRTLGNEQTKVICSLVDQDGDGTFEVLAGLTGGIGPPEPTGPKSYTSHISTGLDRPRLEAWSGRVDPSEVERVVVVRSDGVEIEATLTDAGAFLAWWPGSATASEIITLDSEDEPLTRWTPASLPKP